MHLALSSDIFGSFQNYQRRIIDEYNRLAHDFGFITIDARESINKIQAELRAHVSDYLRRAQSGVLPQPGTSVAGVIAPTRGPAAQGVGRRCS